jgi:serine phosphatase RsbU (regulator of sigma subunit)
MTADLGHAIGYLPFPLGMTATAEHVVVRLNAPARRLLGDVLGRPVRETLPHPGLLATLDAAYHDGLPGRAVLSVPPVEVSCAPLRDGVLLHLTRVDAAATDARSRAAALQRLTGELSRAATPSEIARLAVTIAAELLDADGASVFSRTGPETLEALHTTGWLAETTERYRRIPVQRGRPLSDAVLDGVAVWLENAAQWRLRYPEMAIAGTAEGFQATACLPMRVEDRDVGALVFSFRTPRAFSPDERDYLRAVTALCAQALDRARLLVAEQAARAAAERQLDRMTFLARAGRLLEAPLSVEQRLQQLADLAVPRIADWCAVHLVRDDRVEQVAVAHSDPEKVAFVARLQERYPPDPAAPDGAIEVSRTGRPAFFPEIPDELLVDAAVDDEHLALIRSIGLRSAVVVPLLVRGRSLGALTLVHAESGQRFDEVDLAFASQLAANAAVALDNARLYERQQQIAEILQTALLPAALPVVPGLRIAACYRPQSDDGALVHVGGDLYDVVPAGGPGRWAVVVADVCGKGPEAAALTALIRHTVRAEIDHDPGPAEVLHRLNRAMVHGAGTPARFATVIQCLLAVDADGAAVRLANAGHPPPLLLRSGRVEEVSEHGTVLGVFPDVRLPEVTFRLDRGDMMVLFTDGVTEARGVDGLYGMERLSRLLCSSGATTADGVADALIADVLAFQRGGLRDDVAIVVVEATTSGTSGTSGTPGETA